MSTEIIGRNVIVSVGPAVISLVVIGNARTKSLTINNEPIDVTADDDAGIRRYMSAFAERSVDISIEGVFRNAVATQNLIDLSLASPPVAFVRLNFGTFTITGTFFMSSFESGADYKDAATYSCSFASSGAITKAVV